MKFIDEATISVQSGKGGSGCVSFRRERFIPKGGPDGGDGGKGGDVIFISTLRKRTLHHFQFKRQFSAKNGENGKGSQKTGRAGEDVTIELPPGTIVRDAETFEIIKDFSAPDQSLVVAVGGRGGRGNRRFKSSTNRSPRYSQPGEPGETRTLKLELKLLADVGLVGMPNAGKSTLIRAISSARPKVGDYPFTTLTPNLGVVQTGWGEPFVVADIPGLIEGAHQGAGLGIRFLRHIERTRVLVHLVDVTEIDESDPLASYRIIKKELSSYSELLDKKPRITVLNKMDIEGAKQKEAIFKDAIEAKGGVFLSISAANGKGLDHLISEISKMLDECCPD